MANATIKTNITIQLIILLLSFAFFGALHSCKPNQSNNPTASLKINVTDGISPLVVTFDASGSSTPNGTITSYLFNFGDGSSQTVTTSKTSHTYTGVGTFYASVTVTDSSGKTAKSSLYSISVVSLGTGDVTLGDPTYSGNGCPSGTINATLSPDNKTLSVLFDQFIANAGNGSGGLLSDRKSCSLAIPVHLPNGYSVSVYKIDFRGHAEIPLNGDALGNLKVDYFFAGQQGVSLTKSFAPGFADDFTITDDLAATAEVWSSCGEDVILRTNTNISVKTNVSAEATMLSIDSIDMATGLTYHIRYQACQKK
ncbi:MAG: DUF4360 domain-containing protein [Oligoflexia bacterium]|nr:DUF4360 domain-containing protein [Oligoflexia bacterium]